MTDSVDVVEASRNKGDIESTVQNWLDSNSVTSVDDIELHRRGQNKTLIVIAYTA
jgi:hypothetical protein